jgi:peptide/nickel transport system ATP-binding protein
MSMVFQEPMTSLNPLMTVETQIGEALAVHGKASAAERRERILQLLEDAQFPSPPQVAPMYPHELSGGMRQRVMIAMALANNPALLVADEPTTALDVTIQREILETLQRLRASYNLSVLFISHDLALVNRYADRIGVLYAGVMMESGATSEIIRSPSHPYTKALLNCVPRPRSGGQLQTGIEGVVPRIEDWFEGCRFAPRCGRAEEATCRRGEVPVKQLAGVPRGEHRTRCHFPL